LQDKINPAYYQAGKCECGRTLQTYDYVKDLPYADATARKGPDQAQYYYQNVNLDSGNFDAEAAYNFGVFGMSLGAAGVILAIIAMVKRK